MGAHHEDDAAVSLSRFSNPFSEDGNRRVLEGGQGGIERQDDRSIEIMHALSERLNVEAAAIKSGKWHIQTLKKRIVHRYDEEKRSWQGRNG
jgi:hypothetical protein